MAKTTKKRSHDNNKARLTARERVNAMWTNWGRDNCDATTVMARDARRLIVAMSNALQAHARTTLDRAKRRGK